MSMTENLPDDQGWYWAECADGEWMMAFVDTGNEKVVLYEGEAPEAGELHCGFEQISSCGIKRWFGPFTCPGGDFGGSTVEKDAEHYDRAKKERKAMVVVHVDYRYCRDEGHGSSITVTSTVPREVADKYVRREVDAVKKENAEQTAGDA